MKGYFAITLFISIVIQSNGQTFSEWFRQSKTQKKYLAEQIAALQVYRDYLEKGYLIFQAGLHQIKNSKQGDIDLHTDYFNSLKNVNPNIKSCKAANDIISLELEIQSIAKRVLKQVKTVKVINAAQREYIGTVFKKLMEVCEEDVGLLLQLLTPNLLDLKDNERLNKIDELYADMREKYLFARSFKNKVDQLQLSKELEGKDIEAMQKAFDIKK